jgi:hypothetical protein
MGSRQEVSAVIAKHHLHDQTQLLLLRADAAAPMPAAPPMPTRRPPLLPLRLPPAAARLQVHGRRPRIGAAGQRGRLCSLRIPLSGKGTANDVVFPALGSVTSAAAAAAGASCHSPLACACGFRCPFCCRKPLLPAAAAAGSCCCRKLLLPEAAAAATLVGAYCRAHRHRRCYCCCLTCRTPDPHSLPRTALPCPAPAAAAAAASALLQLLHQLSGTEQAAIVRFVDDVEAAWGLRFQPGFNPDLPFMAHLWEPLRWAREWGGVCDRVRMASTCKQCVNRLVQA